MKADALPREPVFITPDMARGFWLSEPLATVYRRVTRASEIGLIEAVAAHNAEQLDVIRWADDGGSTV